MEDKNLFPTIIILLVAVVSAIIGAFVIIEIVAFIGIGGIFAIIINTILILVLLLLIFNKAREFLDKLP